MLLFILALLIAIAGLAAIEFSQAARPRSGPVWSDDVERRLLRARSGSGDGW